MESSESEARARSNTWPQPRPENYKELGFKKENSVLEYPRKNSPRRNAWGDLSYAELITQAISSAPDKRLTLSQIYEWMVDNVPYFKARADANCSAGWKNSIRHNLSLHNKFMRCQNEGPGRSSWWMINPDAKPGKASRRRAASMETGKFEKRRGRAKKRVEVLRNRLRVQDTTQSPSSSVSESSDLFPDSPIHSSTVYQISTDFRSRVSSSASSSGHLSPIPCSESEWVEPTSYSSTYISEQLVRNFDENLELQNNGILQKVITVNEKPSEPKSLSQPPVENFCWSVTHPASPFNVSNCQIHGVQPCTCSLTPYTQESYSSSDLFPPKEPSTNSQTHFDPLESVSNQRVKTNPSTAMGQIMDALNNSSSLDDLNFNIETFHGGFDCNVDEVIRHELSMGSTLDFNFSHNQIGGKSVPNSSNSWNI